MKRIKFICGTILLLAIVTMIGIKVSFPLKKMKMSNSTLMCIEALAQDEFPDGSAQKDEDTWQDGPYYDSERKELYYWVHIDVDCYGDGTIECQTSRTVERVMV